MNQSNLLALDKYDSFQLPFVFQARGHNSNPSRVFFCDFLLHSYALDSFFLQPALDISSAYPQKHSQELSRGCQEAEDVTGCKEQNIASLADGTQFYLSKTPASNQCCQEILETNSPMSRVSVNLTQLEAKL